MKRFGFHQGNFDHTLFLKKNGALITCLTIYLDDMIITRNDKGEINSLNEKFFKEIEMKDLKQK